MMQTLDQLSAAATEGELLPCPFCGGVAELDHYQPFRAYRTGEPLDQPAVYCTECSAQIAHYPKDIGLDRTDTAELVMAAWNQRTGQLVAVADDAVERYRHVKRGTVYEVVGEAELQMNADNLVDGSQMMVYRGEDGKLWCRHYDEFHDGRFEALAAKGTGDE